MLYLARKVGQSIIIDNRIEVTITEVKGHTVKLGFVFPADVSVLRKEVYDKISAENQAATPRLKRSAWGWQWSMREHASHFSGAYSACGVILSWIIACNWAAVSSVSRRRSPSKKTSCRRLCSP